jgi:hypothetical protein
LNVPVRIPPVTEQVGDDTTLPDIEQAESLDEKPEPETSTVDPAGPEDGLREMDGPLGTVVVVRLVVDDDDVV